MYVFVFELLSVLLLGACGGGSNGLPDTTPPIVTVNNQITSDTTPAVSGTVDDPGASISVVIDAKTYTATNAGNGTWTLIDNMINPALMLGTYDVVVTATDATGNSGSDSSSNELVIGLVSTIAGTITPSSGSRIDSDVNDPDYAFASNDTINLAQSLPNPVSLGGFVSVSGSGLSGSRFEFMGDRQDYFSVQLLAGQTIGLNPSNVNSDLDLILYDSIGNELLRPRLGLGQNESITVPGAFSGARDFFIEVRAVAGVSNYSLTVGLSTSTVNNSELKHDFVPGEVIVDFKENVMPTNVGADSLVMRANSVGLQAVVGAPGRSMLMRLGNAGQLSVAKKKLNIATKNESVSAELQRKIDTIEVVNALAKRADVKSARLNYIYKPMAMPNDPEFTAQWHYPLINLPQAWDISKGSANVIVAVVDTGVLLNHPDFVNANSSSQLVPGFDFIRDADIAADNESGGIIGDIDANPNDPGDRGLGFASTFHGTHVAGTVAAATNNATGASGVGWNVKVMPLRALGVGGGTSYDIEQAILYAAGLPNDSGDTPIKKADVINLSLGGTGGAGATPAAYLQARAAGVIIVAAAGNESSSLPVYPASYDDAVLSVGAVDLNKEKAFYSNFGSHVDVAAPGGDSSQNLNGDSYPDGVLSTQGSDASGSVSFTYGIKQGTSMATPHIAGVAALMKSVHSALTPVEFETALQNGAITEDLGAVGRDDLFGHGLIDALKAVLTAQQLAAGGALPDNPFLAVSPGSLNFGTSGVSAALNVRNTGTGATPLTITSVSNDSGGWLMHTPPAGGGDLGNYFFTVNRSNLADNTYSATVTIVSSVNTVTIPVIMQVASVPIFDDAGLHYVLLYDPATSTVLDQVAINASNGSYRFSFNQVEPGEYQIFAGTDMDNDGFICNSGEACGIYPDDTPSNSTFTLTRDLLNADFVTGFSVGLSSNVLSGVPTSNVPGQEFGIQRLLPLQ